MKKYFCSVVILHSFVCLFAQNVGIGTNTPNFKLTVASSLVQPNNNTHVLSLRGRNPVLSFSNENDISYGYLKMWTDAPFAPYTNGLVIGANPGYPLFFSTNNYGVSMTVADDGNVGVGTTLPDYKLTIASNIIQGNNNTHVLKLKGRNPVLSFNNENDVSYGYIKMWTNAPFAPYTNGLVIGANPGYPLFFSTNNYGVSMTVADNGNIGIGTTTPSTALHINKNDEALRLSGTGQYISFYEGNNYKSYLWNVNSNMEIGTAFSNTNGEINLKTKGVQGLTVQSDGRVRVGNLGCNFAVDANGGYVQYPKLSIHGPLGLKKSWDDQIGEWTLYYSSQNYGANNYADVLTFFFNGGHKASIDDVDGSYYSVSDRRLKEYFENYKPVLPGIKKLDVLTYQFIADKTGRRSFGLVAQNLKEYFPELVLGSDKENGKYLAISYAKTGVLAIKAIQEQQEIIEAQQKKIETLEKRLSALENKIAKQ